MNHAEVKKYQIYDSVEVQLSSRKKLSSILDEENILPVRISFCDSIYGFCESFSFMVDELLDAHFLKESLIANATSSRGQLKVPLYTAFEFTVQADGDQLKTEQWYSASELLKLDSKTLPKLVMVESGCAQSKKSSQFKDGELLIIKTCSISKSKIVDCFSILYRENKKIHKSSLVRVLAYPSQVKLSFIDVIYFDLPLRVVLSSTTHRLSEPCEIKSLTKEKSLITSYCSLDGNDNPGTKTKLYEIFLNTQLDFQIAQYPEHEKESLYEKSAAIYKTFTPNHVDLVISDSDIGLQRKIYNATSLMTGVDWKSVTELILPKPLQSRISSKPYPPLPSQSHPTQPIKSPPLPPKPKPKPSQVLDHNYTSIQQSNPLPLRRGIYTQLSKTDFVSAKWNPSNTNTEKLKLEDFSTDQVSCSIK